jgi:hypothetical protein
LPVVEFGAGMAVEDNGGAETRSLLGVVKTRGKTNTLKH